jgi:hypothetical protein
MKVWAWIAGILAGVGIVALLASGADDRTYAGRQREGLAERSAQSLVVAPPGVGADVTLSIATEDNVTPPDVRSSLEQVQQLLATAATQEGDQAKATLEQARDQLQTAIDATEDAAADTSNDANRQRLLVLAQLLERIEEVIQLRIDHS